MQNIPRNPTSERKSVLGTITIRSRRIHRNIVPGHMVLRVPGLRVPKNKMQTHIRRRIRSGRNDRLRPSAKSL